MPSSDIHGLSRMKLPRINQIGILVKDIPEAIRNYSKLLNIGHWYRSKTVKNTAMYLGRPISIDLDIVLAFQGGMELELIQVMGSDECVYSDLLRSSGSGIHHFGFTVSGYDKKLERMKASGIEVIQSGIITTEGSAITRYAYLDTIKECGIITELIATTLKGLWMPHRNFIMEIGCITGDVERVQV